MTHSPLHAVDGAAAAAVVVHPGGCRLPDQQWGWCVIKRRYSFLLLLLPTELFYVGFGQRRYVHIDTRVDRYTSEFACMAL